MNRIIIKFSSLLLILTTLLIPSISQAQQPEDLQILYVGAQTVECVGVAPQTCLQIKSSPEAEWELLYNGIVNFQPAIGVEYTILVQVVDTPSDVADAPSFQYQLVQILTRTQIDEETTSLSSHYAPTNEWFILEVASETADCVGVGPMTCLQVRMAGEENWTFHYDEISNFVHVAGFEYVLLVQKMTLTEDNLADVSSFIYRLDRIIQKVSVDNGDSSVVMLDGTSWVLRGYETGDVFEAVADNSEITLDFINGEIAGSAGCNRYFSTYIQVDDQLTLGAIGSTRMACQDTVMEQELRFFEGLASVSMFIMDGTSLKIQIGEDTFMIFDPLVSTD